MKTVNQQNAGPGIPFRFKLRSLRSRAPAEAEDVWVHHSAIARALARLGFSYKKSPPLGRFALQIACRSMGSRMSGGEAIAPWVIEGAMRGAAFDTCVETRLAPVLQPGTVDILENVSTHRSPRAAEALRARGCWFHCSGKTSP